MSSCSSRLVAQCWWASNRSKAMRNHVSFRCELLWNYSIHWRSVRRITPSILSVPVSSTRRGKHWAECDIVKDKRLARHHGVLEWMKCAGRSPYDVCEVVLTMTTDDCHAHRVVPVRLYLMLQPHHQHLHLAHKQDISTAIPRLRSLDLTTVT